MSRSEFLRALEEKLELPQGKLWGDRFLHK